MNENDDLIRRLRTLGQQQVAPHVAARHLAAMNAPGPQRRSTGRFKIVAAFVVGLFAGTTGLASAGALPDPVQEVAHDTFAKVGVNVPRGDRYQGAECTADGEHREFKNHGDYVRSQPKGEARSEAAQKPCGKPLGAGTGDDAKPESGAGDCQGKPPWAGAGKNSDPAAKQAAQAERRARCGGSEAEAKDGADTPEQKDVTAEGSKVPAVEAPPAADDSGSTTTTTLEQSTTTTTLDESTTSTTADSTTSTTADSTTSTTADGTADEDQNADEGE